MRLALRRQPTSPAFRELAPYIDRKARHWRAFAIRRPVSVLPISPNEGRIRGKSLADAANIPDSERLWSETEFDRHYLVSRAVSFTQRILSEARPAGIRTQRRKSGNKAS